MALAFEAPNHILTPEVKIPSRVAESAVAHPRLEALHRRVDELRKTKHLVSYSETYERLIIERIPNGIDSPGLVVSTFGANYSIVADGPIVGQQVLFSRQVYYHRDEVPTQKISLYVTGSEAPDELSAGQVHQYLELVRGSLESRSALPI